MVLQKLAQAERASLGKCGQAAVGAERSVRWGSGRRQRFQKGTEGLVYAMGSGQATSFLYSLC